MQENEGRPRRKGAKKQRQPSRTQENKVRLRGGKQENERRPRRKGAKDQRVVDGGSAKERKTAAHKGAKGKKAVEEGAQGYNTRNTILKYDSKPTARIMRKRIFTDLMTGRSHH